MRVSWLLVMALSSFCVELNSQENNMLLIMALYVPIQALHCTIGEFATCHQTADDFTLEIFEGPNLVALSFKQKLEYWYILGESSHLHMFMKSLGDVIKDYTLPKYWTQHICIFTFSTFNFPCIYIIYTYKCLGNQLI